MNNIEIGKLFIVKYGNHFIPQKDGSDYCMHTNDVVVFLSQYTNSRFNHIRNVILTRFGIKEINSERFVMYYEHI
jgi:hypothetical protein